MASVFANLLVNIPFQSLIIFVKELIITKKNILLKIICVVALPVLILSLIGKPTKQGFYCFDESLQYPYTESTVSDVELLAFGTLVPLIFVILVEVYRSSRTPNDSSSGNIYIPKSLRKIPGLFPLLQWSI